MQLDCGVYDLIGDIDNVPHLHLDAGHRPLDRNCHLLLHGGVGKEDKIGYPLGVVQVVLDDAEVRLERRQFMVECVLGEFVDHNLAARQHVHDHGRRRAETEKPDGGDDARRRRHSAFALGGEQRSAAKVTGSGACRTGDPRLDGKLDLPIQEGCRLVRRHKVLVKVVGVHGGNGRPPEAVHALLGANELRGHGYRAVRRPRRQTR
mmetsp:Transcript_82348/g.255768  ORF Transcript_82348/g.255768 Transcript_82348/m.255768 type:complete len:206 (-) Transcript_82348:647-1264(-)